MDTLLGTLRQTRHDLIERGTKIAEATRDRGLDALGKVRGGALDWRRTLATRRATLEETSGWFRFAGLQLRVLDGVDRALARFALQVRAEMKRLRGLELPRASQVEAEPREAAANDNATAEPTPKTARAKRPSARKTANGEAKAPKRLVLPIADYETLNVKQVMAELPRLTEAQCKAILEHERTHKKRKTILEALSAPLAS